MERPPSDFSTGIQAAELAAVQAIEEAALREQQNRLDAEKAAATEAAVQARTQRIEDRIVGGDVQQLNDKAMFEIYGSEIPASRSTGKKAEAFTISYTVVDQNENPEASVVIGSQDAPLKGVLDQIREVEEKPLPIYLQGRPKAERDEAKAKRDGELARQKFKQEKLAKKYESDVLSLVEDEGFELSQAKLIMDLRTEDTSNVVKTADALITKYGMPKKDAEEKAAAIYVKKDETRRQLIKEGGAFTRAEYDAVRKGSDLYANAVPAADPAPEDPPTDPSQPADPPAGPSPAPLSPDTPPPAPAGDPSPTPPSPEDPPTDPSQPADPPAGPSPAPLSPDTPPTLDTIRTPEEIQAEQSQELLDSLSSLSAEEQLAKLAKLHIDLIGLPPPAGESRRPLNAADQERLEVISAALTIAAKRRHQELTTKEQFRLGNNEAVQVQTLRAKANRNAIEEDADYKSAFRDYSDSITDNNSRIKSGRMAKVSGLAGKVSIRSLKPSRRKPSPVTQRTHRKHNIAPKAAKRVARRIGRVATDVVQRQQDRLKLKSVKLRKKPSSGPTLRRRRSRPTTSQTPPPQSQSGDTHPQGWDRVGTGTPRQPL